jgi:hypothetical protein
MIADVLSIYAEDVAPRQERRKEVAARLSRLLDFFGTKRLDQLNAKLCAATSLHAALLLRHVGSSRI